jgi:hypothetical protein
MSHDSRGNEPDQVNNGALAVVLGIVAVATLAVALVVTALVRDEVSGMNALRDVTQDREYRELKNEQLAVLEGPARWMDRAKGVASVPVSRAMALTIEEVRRNPQMLSPWFKAPVPETQPAEGASTADTSVPAAPAPADAHTSATATDTKPTAAPASPPAPLKAGATTSVTPKPASTKPAAPATPAPDAAPKTAPAPVAPTPAGP